MAERMRWAIIGAGNIAKAFAKGVKASKTGELVTVGSRSLEKAEAFCQEFGGRAFGSYAEAVEDAEVDAVYIALPHSGHEEWTIKCAQAGKHVLCEKPFTLDLPSAERAIAAVKEAGVFFAEAFMYRFHPQTKAVKKIVAEGVIGEVRQINAEFSFNAGTDWENFRTQRAEGGGGLMDVGTYCTSAIRLYYGEEPVRCEFAFVPAGDGYDGSSAGLLVFEGGRTATFSSGVHLNNQNRVRIYGTKGHIEIESPWFCKGRVWVRVNGEDEVEHGPWEVDDLYATEADEVAAYLEAKEIPMMSIADTLGNMRTLDMLRKSGGLSWEVEG